MIVRPVLRADVPAIASLYSHYVLHTTVSFEEAAVGAEAMGQRVDEVVSAGLPWLVADHSGELRGFAYAGKWKARSAYRFSVESSVYVAPQQVGQGIGAGLYAPLLAELRAQGLRTVLGGIALPNDASVRLHERFGFAKCAHLTEVGFKFGRWIDVGYWQLALHP